MANIGTKIAELRKTGGMTQEELAGILGVSSQTISKWENSTTMPDIMLLPLIADTFGVTIDELFGNAAETSSCGISFADVPNTVHEKMIESMQRAFTLMDTDTCTPSQLRENVEKVQSALKDGHASAVYTDHGDAVYVTEKLGIMVKRQDGGMASLLNDPDTAEIFRIFASDSVRALLLLLMERETVKFTLPSLVKKLSLPEEEIRTALSHLEQYGFVRSSAREVDDEVIPVYEANHAYKTGVLYGMLACAAEIRKARGYRGYRGSMLKNF